MCHFALPLATHTLPQMFFHLLILRFHFNLKLTKQNFVTFICYKVPSNTLWSLNSNKLWSRGENWRHYAIIVWYLYAADDATIQTHYVMKLKYIFAVWKLFVSVFPLEFRVWSVLIVKHEKEASWISSALGVEVKVGPSLFYQIIFP